MKKRQFLKLELQKESLQHRLSKMSGDVLRFKTNSGSWSIMDILMHIILVEELAVQQAKKKLKNGALLRSLNWKAYYRYVLLLLALYSKRKFKAPTVAMPTDNQYDLEALFYRWNSTRTEMELLLDHSPSKLRMGVFKHPVVGYLNMKQMIGFLEAHYSHHLVQINYLVELKH